MHAHYGVGKNSYLLLRKCRINAKQRRLVECLPTSSVKQRKSLSETEKERIIEVCNLPEYKSLPPSQIVPMLADKGEYIVSESSFYRILSAVNQVNRRGRAQMPKNSMKPKGYNATGPNQVWSWDISVPQQAAGEMRDYGPSSSACRCW